MKAGKSWLRKLGIGVFALAMAGVAANAGVISAGYYDSFGVKADNSVWGWGSDGGVVNNYADATLTQYVSVAIAQLGLGSTNSMILMNGEYVVVSPRQSGTAKTWVDVVGGANCGFGIQSDGSLWGWGYDGRPVSTTLGSFYRNHYEQCGQLGLGAQMCQIITSVYAPVAVETTYDIWFDNKYIKTDTYPICTNSVMNGLTTNQPTQVGSGTTWRQVAAGDTFGLGLQADGSIWSWGSESMTTTPVYQANGQLGQGDMLVISTNITGGEIYSRVTQHYTNDGTIITHWSLMDVTTNTLTNSVTTNVVYYARALNTPAKITAPMPMVDITAGAAHSVAIGSDGSLWTWGKNQYVYIVSGTNYSYGYANGSVLGLGDTTLISTNVPTRVGSETTWASVSAGLDDQFTLAIKQDGSLWGWGNNGADWDWDLINGTNILRTYARGCLGLGSNTLFANTPTRVGTDNNWAMVSAGNWFSLGLKSDGSLYAWGYNGSGNLGIGRTVACWAEPIRIGTDNDWVFISAGYDHSLALKLDGSLWGWGDNAHAALGDQLGNAYEPVKISDGWGLAAAEGDFDGDRIADPYVVVNGGWTFWFSSWGYLPSGPYVMSVPGGVPLVGDFDGDGLADPVMVAKGAWTLWLSSGGYLPWGPYIFAVPGGVPVTGDFDGDRMADPAMVANGNWTFWYSRGGYLPSGPYVMSVPGGKPLAGDFDGDRYADQAMVANGAWTFWFSSDNEQLPWGPYIFTVPGKNPVPMAGDFDGDGLADPTMVINNNWTFWFTSGGYLPWGPYSFVP